MNLDQWKDNTKSKVQKTNSLPTEAATELQLIQDAHQKFQKKLIHDLAGPLQNILMTIEAIEAGIIENNEQALQRLKFSVEKINDILKANRHSLSVLVNNEK